MASSLEFNKLLAGVLTAGIIASASGIIAGILYRPQPLDQHAFSVAVPEGADEAADGVADDTPPLANLLADADPSAGETITRQCTACHVFAEGGDNRVGPVLWGVVGRDIASVPGFNYSPALTGLDGDWDYEALDQFLADPRGYAPGTSMSYAGLRGAEDRANLIAYLRSLAHDPLPLPEPQAETVTPEEHDVGAAEADGEPAEDVAADAPAETPAEETATDVTEGAEPDETAAPTDTAEAATEGDSAMVALVEAADPADGEQAFRQCAACHTATEDGANRVGPALWDVYGQDVATVDGFNYSPALQAIEGSWDVAKLDAYLENPREYAPGNRMAFAGVRSPEQRAAIIAFLHSLSNDPKPLQ